MRTRNAVRTVDDRQRSCRGIRTIGDDEPPVAVLALRLVPLAPRVLRRAVCQAYMYAPRVEEELRQAVRSMSASRQRHRPRMCTYVVPSVNELRDRALLRTLHQAVHALDYKEPCRQTPQSALPSNLPQHSLQRNAPKMMPTPRANGASPDTTRFIGDNEPATLRSCKNLLQSCSFTS